MIHSARLKLEEEESITLHIWANIIYYLSWPSWFWKCILWKSPVRTHIWDSTSRLTNPKREKSSFFGAFLCPSGSLTATRNWKVSQAIMPSGSLALARWRLSQKYQRKGKKHGSLNESLNESLNRMNFRFIEISNWV